MDNQVLTPSIPPASPITTLQSDLPVSEIVSALKSAPAVTPPTSPLQEITSPPVSPVIPAAPAVPTTPVAPTPTPAAPAPQSEAQIPSISEGQTTNPLFEDPDKVISPGNK